MLDLTDGKILVTGADGFIGSHLVEELVRRGATVRAFVYYNSFNSLGWLEGMSPEVRANVEIFFGDIRDAGRVQQAVDGCSVVFHLAAVIAIPFSYDSPETYLDTNVRGTLNVLQAVRSSGTAKLVHTSTSEVYGTAQYVPIDELHPLQAQSPYAATKTAADQLASSFWRSFGTPVAIARPFNTYGPRQSARAVIPTIITQIAQGRTKIRLGSLHPTRDFSYVADTVSGFIAIAESEQSIGEVINLGSNFEISVGDTVSLIARVMGVEISIESDDQRLRPDRSEVERLWASNEKALRLANWSPSYAGTEGLARGLEKTVAWFKRAENLARYGADQYVV